MGMGSHRAASMADSSNDQDDDPEYRKRRETNNKSVAKNRARKKEEKKAKEELRKENQEIEQRTAVHQQELSFLRQVVTAHVQENGQGILEAEPVLKEFLEEKDQNSG